MMLRLYNAGVLRRLKSAAKARARASGRKSATGQWWRPVGSGRSYFWLIWLAVNLVRFVGEPNSTEALKLDLFGGMSLAFAGLALSWSRKYADLLTIGGERRVLWFYPVSERNFFEWTTFRFAVRSIWVALVAAIVYSVGTSTTGANGWIVRISAPLAEWLIVLAIAIALTRHMEKLPRWLPLGLYVCAGLLLLVPDQYGKSVAPLASALPTGWLHVFLRHPRVQSWSGFAAICFLLAVTFLCWRLLKHLQAIYCRAEIAAMEAPTETFVEPQSALEEAPGGEQLTTDPKDSLDRFAAEHAQAEKEAADDPELEEAGEAVLPIQATWQKQRIANRAVEAGEFLRDRQWLQLWNWNEMRPIERVVGWVLTEHQKGIMQFLLGPVVPNWTSRWRTSAIAAAVGVAAALAGTWEFNMLSALAFAVSIGAGVPILGGVWPVTNQGRISGKFSPIFGCYPLGYWSACWIMFKANLVRTLAWVPLGLAISVLNAKNAEVTVAASCRLFFQALVLFLAFTPILLAGKFSKGSNDTTNLTPRTLPLLIFFVVIIVALFSLGAAALIATGWWAALFLGLFKVVSFSSWAGYGLYYERAQVDLLRDQA